MALRLCACAGDLFGHRVRRRRPRWCGLRPRVGDFDMVLNPTNNPVLQGHVDNMLHYVESDNYRGSWINRADDGLRAADGRLLFAHQAAADHDRQHAAGWSHSLRFQASRLRSTGLSNTVGTVSLALSGLATGGTNQDSGTSSFFVNLASNTLLDADFTVFAAIPGHDGRQPDHGADAKSTGRPNPISAPDRGNLGFTDVPIMANGQQVFIKRAFVMTDAMTIAQATSACNRSWRHLLAAFASGAGGGGARRLRLRSSFRAGGAGDAAVRSCLAPPRSARPRRIACWRWRAFARHRRPRPRWVLRTRLDALLLAVRGSTLVYTDCAYGTVGNSTPGTGGSTMLSNAAMFGSKMMLPRLFASALATSTTLKSLPVSSRRRRSARQSDRC